MLGRVLFDCSRDLFFKLALQHHIDGQLDVRPGLAGNAFHARHHRLAERIDLQDFFSRHATELLVELGFKTCRTLAIGLRKPEHVRGKWALAIGAGEFAAHVHARQAQRFDPIGGGIVDVFRQRAAVAVGFELRAQQFAGHAQQP